jgi:hypothetical protein
LKQNVTLSAKQHRTINALLRCATLREAAASAGVSRKTLWAWLRESAFQSAFQTASAQMLDDALSTLQSASLEAVECLRIIMADSDARAAARVSAAHWVVEMALRVRETTAIEQRIAALEARLPVGAPRTPKNPPTTLRRVK